MHTIVSNFQVVTFDSIPDTSPLNETKLLLEFIANIGVSLRFSAGRQYIIGLHRQAYHFGLNYVLRKTFIPVVKPGYAAKSLSQPVNFPVSGP